MDTINDLVFIPTSGEKHTLDFLTKFHDDIFHGNRISFQIIMKKFWVKSIIMNIYRYELMGVDSETLIIFLNQ